MTEASSGERARRALADIVGDSRPRVAGDGEDPTVPVAATVVLVRDSDAGPEVLVIERPDRGSFAGAWVFPGGKLEDVDRAEAGSEEDDARRAAVRETGEETGLSVGPDELVTLSVWDPPPGLALRIRTWFFVAYAPDAEPVLQPDEAVAHEWVRPHDLLARHGRGDVTLYPPTWVTLHGLGAAASASGLLETTRMDEVRRFETVARRAPGGPLLLWPDDAEYGGPGEGSARHRLDVGALPWTYTVSE